MPRFGAASDGAGAVTPRPRGIAALIVAAVAALVWANSPWGGSYSALWHTEVTVGDLSLSKDLTHWVNDGLMALFFLVVGLEIKREVLVGELSSLRGAALPVVAALGGAVVPALIYLAINAGGDGAAGWGIPMATDIAFALGVLTLLGERAPVGLKVFLTALAIANNIYQGSDRTHGFRLGFLRGDGPPVAGEMRLVLEAEPPSHI